MAAPGDWNRSDWPKLWLYNLHYFDDLVSEGAEERLEWHRELISRWIAENPPTDGNGWEPYPTSLRLVNWCKWLLRGNEPVDGMLDSMSVQVRLLRRRLEYHLLGNHLWVNLKALIFAGVFFQGREAEGWRRHGLRGFRAQLDEQVLADGGHFERSPMYHALLSEDLLDLVQLSQRFPGALPDQCPGGWAETALRMLSWLETMSHPDGGPAFFNDTAFGIAPPYADLAAYAGALGLKPKSNLAGPKTHLRESGYVRLQSGPAVLLTDVAPLGPDYLPGHAHADTLSFEFSLHGHRVFVNGGTSTYENGRQRQMERSTAQHNTVEVDGEDSSEVWGAFRVARRARVFDVTVDDCSMALEASAAHDGYRRLPGRVIHRRRWVLSNGGLLVEDRLAGSWTEASARFRLAPGLSVEVESATCGRIVGRDLVIGWQADGGEVRVEESSWYPEFGRAQRCEVLVMNALKERLVMQFNWSRFASG